MTLLLFSCQHPLVGTSRSRRRTPFIPAPAGHHRTLPNEHFPIHFPISPSKTTPATSSQSSAAFSSQQSSQNAAAATNPHRRSSVHRFPAGSFFRGFRTPALYRIDRSCSGRHRKPFSKPTNPPARSIVSSVPTADIRGSPSPQTDVSETQPIGQRCQDTFGDRPRPGLGLASRYPLQSFALSLSPVSECSKWPMIASSIAVQ